MFCPKCGKEIKDGSKFCKHCGSEIKKNKAASTPNNVSPSSSDDEKTKKIIIGVLVAAIVILAIVFVAFGTGLFNGDSQNANGNNQQIDTSSSKPVSLSSFPVSEAPALAQAIKNNGGKFPVSFKSLSLTKAQCLYILTKSISQISSGHPDATISVGDYAYAPHPSGSDSPQTIQRANYVDMCNRFSTWMEGNNAAPNYVGIYTGGVPDISPTKMMDICINILLNYGKSHNLPADVKI